jgi:hypothetical protein
MAKVNQEGLKHLFILSEGLKINGSQLVEGLRESSTNAHIITGGLAADGDLFEKTLLIDQNGQAQENIVIALAFYGAIEVESGCYGGWDSFGLERKATRSLDNELFEVDGKPALDLYRSFLGEKASELPASGLLFPVNIGNEANAEPIVRTILGINEERKSLIFAGDIPQGSYLRLMKANVNRLIGGAEKAPQKLRNAQSILVRCVGRKLVLKQLVEDEVEAVAELMAPKRF